MVDLADIHCHLLPYVDDGAEDLSISLQLIASEAEQGVRTICVTPHLRKGMFESSDHWIREKFQQLKDEVRQQYIPVRLCLGREYHYDSGFRKCLAEGKVIPLGNGTTLLVEFSSRHVFEELLEGVERVQKAGYQPLIAHVERYPATCGQVDRVRQLIDAGAMIQVNADSILGLEGFKRRMFTRKLLKQQLVHVVASDAHDLKYRPSRIAQCGTYIEKKMGTEYAQTVLHNNPLSILGPLPFQREKGD
jgi:protein-tyrosine phosphatase